VKDICPEPGRAKCNGPGRGAGAAPATAEIPPSRPVAADTVWVAPDAPGNPPMAHATTASDPAGALAKAGPYPMAAYQFLQEGLRHTVRQVHEQRSADPSMGDMADGDHVTGQQLCVGLRDYAIGQFGLLAPVVLESWSIRRTDDFGRMVFAMIDAGLMSKTAHDTPEDFCGVYDFEEAFHREHAVAAIRAPAV